MQTSNEHFLRSINKWLEWYSRKIWNYKKIRVRHWPSIVCCPNFTVDDFIQARDLNNFEDTKWNFRLSHTSNTTALEIIDSCPDWEWESTYVWYHRYIPKGGQFCLIGAVTSRTDESTHSEIFLIRHLLERVSLIANSVIPNKAEVIAWYEIISIDCIHS